MSFTEPEGGELLLDKPRLVVGTLAACLAPAFVLAFLVPLTGLEQSPSLDAWLFLSLVLSPFVIFFFLPVILWQLPGSDRPLLACLAAGGCSIAAPLALVALIFADAGAGREFAEFALVVVAIALPVGLAAGLVFWLCVVWRNPGARHSR